MPIRTRVQRLWRLVVDWWRSSPDNRPASPVAPTAPASPAPASVTPRSHGRRPASEGARSREGEALIGGAVTVRMWLVDGRLVLATSHADAERALVALLPDLDAEGQRAARTLLDALHGGHAAAA